MSSRRSLGNLDGTSEGIGGTNSVRVEAGTGDFRPPRGKLNDAGYVKGFTGEPLSKLKLQNLGTGHGVYSRQDLFTFSFKSLVAGEGVQITTVGDHIVFTNTLPYTDRFLNLRDTPSSFKGMDGKILAVDESTFSIKFIDPPRVSTSFTDLVDVPTSYAGMNGKYLRVNESVSRIEFADVKMPPSITFSETPPENPETGAAWWDITSGDIFYFYKDSNSQQWVEFAGDTRIIEQPYDYGTFFENTPAANEVIFRWRAPRSHKLGDNFSGCIFTCDVNPSAVFICKVLLNGQEVGTWRLNTDGSRVLTSNRQLNIPAGSEIKVVAPSVRDLSVKGLVVSFKGELQ